MGDIYEDYREVRDLWLRRVHAIRGHVQYTAREHFGMVVNVTAYSHLEIMDEATHEYVRVHVENLSDDSIHKALTELKRKVEENKRG